MLKVVDLGYPSPFEVDRVVDCLSSAKLWLNFRQVVESRRASRCQTAHGSLGLALATTTTGQHTQHIGWDHVSVISRWRTRWIGGFRILQNISPDKVLCYVTSVWIGSFLFRLE